MSNACKETCNEHSGMSEKIENLRNELLDTKSDIQEFKGWNRGKFERVDIKIEELSKDLTKRINDGMKEIKDLIEKKEEKKDNTKLLLITSLLSPLIVGVLLIISDKFLK